MLQKFKMNNTTNNLAQSTGMLVGNHRFEVEPMPYYISTSGAMQRVCLEFPSASTAQQMGNDTENNAREHAYDELAAATASKSKKENDRNEEDAAIEHDNVHLNQESEQE